MAKEIIKYFPTDENINTYIEPFGGSFSIGLKVVDRFPNMIYNDLEKNVYSLFKVLSTPEHFSKFKTLCDLACYDENLRTDLKNELKVESIDIVTRAFCFYYVNRTSRNGIGAFCPNLVVRRNMSKSVSDYLSSVDGLDVLHQHLSKVIISNDCGISLIKKYDKKDVLFYLDLLMSILQEVRQGML